MRKLNGAMKFFLIVLVIYLVVLLIDYQYVVTAFSDFLDTLLKVIPLIVGVYVVMFIVNVFLNPEKINKHLGHDSGIKGWFYSVIAGVLIPAPPYVVFPLLGDLREQGMRNALIVSFLYNRNLQVAFLPVIAYYFGVLLTIVISFYIFVFGILSGVVIERLLRMNPKG